MPQPGVIANAVVEHPHWQQEAFQRLRWVRLHDEELLVTVRWLGQDLSVGHQASQAHVSQHPAAKESCRKPKTDEDYSINNRSCSPSFFRASCIPKQPNPRKPRLTAKASVFERV